MHSNSPQFAYVAAAERPDTDLPSVFLSRRDALSFPIPTVRSAPESHRISKCTTHPLAGCTAGGELHPAPKTACLYS